MHSLTILAAYLIALAICGVAVWTGDRPLRLAAIVYIASWTLSTMLARQPKWGLDPAITMIDINTSLALTLISLHWRRLWCAVLAAEAILVNLAPIVRMVEHYDVSRYAKSATINVLTVCQLLTLVVAIGLTFRARRRAYEGAVRA